MFIVSFYVEFLWRKFQMKRVFRKRKQQKKTILRLNALAGMEYNYIFFNILEFKAKLSSSGELFL